MASAAIINIVALGVGGLLSAPALVNLFAQPQPEKITINIGVGATNSSAPLPDGQDLKGNTPRVTLYDINGVEIGTGTSDAIISDGGSVTVTIAGQEGSGTSKTPQYIQLSAFEEDPVCVSWITTSSAASDGADFRSWNGAAAQFCGIPWYPSVAPMPGVTALFQPPCFWLSNTASDQSDQTATQWQQFPDTLCDAPGRQQFYKNLGVCIPFYPSGLSIVNQKDPDTGFDADFSAIKSSYTHTCSLAGIPFNNVDLGGGLPTPSVDLEALLSGATLQSALTFPLAGRDEPSGAAQGPVATSTTKPALITEAAKLPEKKVKTRTMKEPVLDRRVEKRHEEAHRWCQENHLVISEFSGHSAVEVCESDSSWGPDFVAVAEGIFCDMCNRQSYPLCGGYDQGDIDSLSSGGLNSTVDAPILANGAAHNAGSRAKVNSTVSAGSRAVVNGAVNAAALTNTTVSNTDQQGASASGKGSSTNAYAAKSSAKNLRSTGAAATTCFDMHAKQLRAPARLRRSGTVPVKNYQVVKHWK